MERWTVEHRMFAYDAFVQNGGSVITVQRLFRVRFNRGRRGTVPSRNTILSWVHNLRTTGSIVKKKPPGPTKTARTPDNIERVRAALTRSPGWGYLKSRVYSHRPRTLAELKEAIRKEVATIDVELMTRVMVNFWRRLENCIQEDGHHLPDVIFHK